MACRTTGLPIHRKNSLDSSAMKLQNKAVEDSIMLSKLNLKPKCFPTTCDSIIICFKDVYGAYPDALRNIPDYNFKKIVDCAFQEIESNRLLASKNLINFYDAVYIYANANNLRYDAPYRMENLRGKAGFELALKFYKLSSDDPGEFGFPPSELFRTKVLLPMIRSLNNESWAYHLFDWFTQVDQKYAYTRTKLEYWSKSKEWWLSLIEKAMAEDKIEYRDYGQLD